MLRRRDWIRRKTAKGVIKEARALLDGAARATTYGRARHIPAWAYVNQLAHADQAELVRLADHGWSQYRTNWEDATAFLASELLARAEGRQSVTDAQRALIPLELDLLAGSYPATASPAMLVGWVSHTLTISGFGRTAR